MRVAVMDVRVMRVTVPDGEVFVQMAVLATCLRFKCVSMLMVFVMTVHMLVFQRLMQVFMGVTFPQVQPHPAPHQRGRHPECR